MGERKTVRVACPRKQWLGDNHFPAIPDRMTQVVYADSVGQLGECKLCGEKITEYKEEVSGT